MSKVVKILNTNLSNMQSIKYAVEGLGYNVKDVDDIKSLKSEELVVIPGVGNYSQAMQNLEPKFRNFKEIADQKSLKILGICLGMQLLFSFSEEGNRSGLNIIPGKVKKLDRFGVDKIPNIGWRKVSFLGNELEKFNNQYFYFVHSYAAEPDNKDNILGITVIDEKEITSVVSEKNQQLGRYIGCQFHPEKSGENGLRFLDYILKKLDNI